MSDPPRRPRVPRGKEVGGGGGGRGSGEDTRTRREHSNPRPPPYHRSTQSRSFPRGSSSRSQSARRAPSRNESKCTHICSRRGIVLICATLTNLLVLFCIVAAQITLSGFSAMNFGGNFVNTLIPFEGVELQQVRDLDMQFGQMRAPGVYGGVAFSLTFGVLSLFFVVSGNKPAYLLPMKLLVGQLVFQLIGAVVYVIAVGLYLHFVISVNSTDVCVQRERLYARNGYTWMNCKVGGADASVALFGIITTILYAVGSFLTFQTLRYVKGIQKERAVHEAERHKQPNRPQSTPLQSDIYI
ncbi:MARVEL domain-containing protein 3 isoform X2 [Hoplias malabaricus]|uniref:MARVEL domain-containing protein 3 isoform X2 n=1 Tax=Hoplias malabaricus TaxID=27720 RepID=UPI003462A61E